MTKCYIRPLATLWQFSDYKSWRVFSFSVTFISVFSDIFGSIIPRTPDTHSALENAYVGLQGPIVLLLQSQAFEMTCVIACKVAFSAWTIMFIAINLTEFILAFDFITTTFRSLLNVARSGTCPHEAVLVVTALSIAPFEVQQLCRPNPVTVGFAHRIS